VIVVLGRPELDERGSLTRRAGRVAAAAAAGGAEVELVGSVTDDAAGDATITELGREAIGHAALLRMPTSREPRLDAADIELGLRYVSDCRVLVVAESLEGAALDAAIDGATYHRAQLIVAAPLVAAAAAQLPEDATVLGPPDEDDGAFADLVGRYAAELDAGRGAADAWRDAITATGWEETAPAGPTTDELTTDELTTDELTTDEL
jgi:hypothetical protein